LSLKISSALYFFFLISASRCSKQIPGCPSSAGESDEVEEREEKAGIRVEG